MPKCWIPRLQYQHRNTAWRFFCWNNVSPGTWKWSSHLGWVGLEVDGWYTFLKIFILPAVLQNMICVQCNSRIPQSKWSKLKMTGILSSLYVQKIDCRMQICLRNPRIALLRRSCFSTLPGELILKSKNGSEVKFFLPSAILLLIKAYPNHRKHF